MHYGCQSLSPFYLSQYQRPEIAGYPKETSRSLAGTDMKLPPGRWFVMDDLVPDVPATPQHHEDSHAIVVAQPMQHIEEPFLTRGLDSCDLRQVSMLRHSLP